MATWMVASSSVTRIVASLSDSDVTCVIVRSRRGLLRHRQIATWIVASSPDSDEVVASSPNSDVTCVVVRC
jgi:hypothetical protein